MRKKHENLKLKLDKTDTDQSNGVTRYYRAMYKSVLAYCDFNIVHPPRFDFDPKMSYYDIITFWTGGLFYNYTHFIFGIFIT